MGYTLYELIKSGADNEFGIFGDPCWKEGRNIFRGFV